MITLKQFQEFDTTVCKEFPYRNQRYGQAFCNYFDITDGSIFYEEKYQKVVDRIYIKYLEG